MHMRERDVSMYEKADEQASLYYILRISWVKILGEL